MLDAQFIAERKEELLKQRDEIKAELKELERVPDMGNDVDSFEEETDEAEEYVTNLSKMPALQKDLQEIEEAIVEIETNKYGVCKKCGKLMTKELLRVAPESRYCKACKLSRPYRKKDQ